MQMTEGATALMYACQQCMENEVLDLIKKQPNSVKDRDRTSKTPLHYCAENPNTSCAEIVLRAAPELVNAQDDNGYSTLHLAVIAGNKALIKLLIAKGADVNIHDNEGHSAVHWAIVSSEKEALEMIIRAGADPSTADIHGGYPLHYAVQMCGSSSDHLRNFEDAVRVVETLLNFGVDVNVKDKDSRQPILWAASAGSPDAVIHLVSSGACVEAADKDGLTALHCAASRGHTTTLETLITLCGANVDVIDANGCSALFYAVTLGHADATELLLKLGAEPNRQDRRGRTPAHCGAAKGQIETLRILQKHGGNLWLRNVKGDIPLHEAVASGRIDLVLWLLSQNPEAINLSNNDGRCPLHIASMYNNTEMVKVLLDSKSLVNPIMRTSKGVLMTPLNVALCKGHRSCGKYLQLHGGVPFSKVARLEPASAFADRFSPSDEMMVRSVENSKDVSPGSHGKIAKSRDATEIQESQKSGKVTSEKKKVYRRRKKKKSASAVPTEESDSDESIRNVNVMAVQGSRKVKKSIGAEESTKEVAKVRSVVKDANSKDNPDTDSSGEAVEDVRIATKATKMRTLLTSKSFNETKNVSDLSPEDFPPLMQTINQLDVVMMEPDVGEDKTGRASRADGAAVEVTRVDEEFQTTVQDGENAETGIEVKEDKIEKSAASSQEKSVKTVGKGEKKPVKTVRKDEEKSVKTVKKNQGEKLVKTVGKVEEDKLAKTVEQNEEKLVKTVGKVEEDKLAKTVEQNEEKLVKTVRRDEEKSLKRVRKDEEEKLVKNIGKDEEDKLVKTIKKDEEEKLVKNVGRDEEEKLVKTAGEDREEKLVKMVRKDEEEELVKTVLEDDEKPLVKKDEEEKLVKTAGEDGMEKLVKTAGKDEEEKLGKTVGKDEEKPAESKSGDSTGEDGLYRKSVKSKTSSNSNSVKKEEKSSKSEKTSSASSVGSDKHKKSVRPKSPKPGTADRAKAKSPDKTKDDLERKPEDEIKENGNEIFKIQPEVDELNGGVIPKDETPLNFADVKNPEDDETGKKGLTEEDVLPDEQDNSAAQKTEAEPTDTPTVENNPEIATGNEKMEEIATEQMEKVSRTEDNAVKASDEVQTSAEAVQQPLEERNNEVESSAAPRSETPPAENVTQNDFPELHTNSPKVEASKGNTEKEVAGTERSNAKAEEPRIAAVGQDVGPEDVAANDGCDEAKETQNEEIHDSSTTTRKNESEDKPTAKVTRVSRLCRRHREFKGNLNDVSVTQLVQNTLRKYHMERGIFYQLLELKRYQIRSGKANEQVLVKRLADEYERSRPLLGMKPFSGLYKFREFEKFLYDQLKALNARRSFLIPEMKSYDDIDAMSGFLKKSRYKIINEVPQPETVCTCITQRCHHSACAYTSVPCAGYITDLRRLKCHKTRKESFFPRIDQPSRPDTDRISGRPPTLELIQGTEKHVISLPQNSPGKGKRYYVTFTIKSGPMLKEEEDVENPKNFFKHRHAKSV